MAWKHLIFVSGGRLYITVGEGASPYRSKQLYSPQLELMLMLANCEDGSQHEPIQERLLNDGYCHREPFSLGHAHTTKPSCPLQVAHTLL
jgi:hypothetical protein